MYVLYLDGSGSVKNPNERHFVLAGIAVHELEIYHVIKRADDYVGTLAAGRDAELHGGAMANAKAEAWKGISRQRRLDFVIRDTSLTTVSGRPRNRVNSDSHARFAAVYAEPSWG